jgi:predicted nucleic-acid-binding protein
MNSLNTNIVLRFLLNDIPSQSSRAKLVFSNPPFYVSDVVVAETVYVLEKSLGYARNYVASLIRVLIAVPGLTYSDHLMANVIDMYESKKSLSFVDCFAAVEAQTFGSKLYTFDKDLIKHGGTHVHAP